MCIKKLAIMWLLVVACVTNSHAQEFKTALTLAPLSKRVTGPLRPVTKPNNIPAIAWGADATIHIAQYEGIFAKNGVKNSTIFRENSFQKQVQMCIFGESPYVRGTTDMGAQADPIFDALGTNLVPIFQFSWSTGDDGIVARKHIRKPEDLRGKIIACQLDGPHVFLLLNVLRNAGLGPNDVTIVWMRDLLYAANDDAPAMDPITLLKLFPKVDAVCGIYPDLEMLTSGGKVGDGSDNSVEGAHIMLTTGEAAGVVADQLFVREDFLKANRAQVQAVVRSLLEADEALRGYVETRSQNQAQWQQRLANWAEFLLDARELTTDMEAMVSAGGMTLAGHPGNVGFYKATQPRNLAVLTNEINDSFVAHGIMTEKADFGSADWDWNVLGKGLKLTSDNFVAKPKFDFDKAQAAVNNRVQGELEAWTTEGTLFQVEIRFKPNQSDFSIDDYAKEFEEAFEKTQTYSGAIVSFEGHSDPEKVRRARIKGEPMADIEAYIRDANNTSVKRAEAARAGFLKFCENKGFKVDESQLTFVGIGIRQPVHFPAKTKTEWEENMRVIVRIRSVSGELDEFVPFEGDK